MSLILADNHRTNIVVAVCLAAIAGLTASPVRAQVVQPAVPPSNNDQSSESANGESPSAAVSDSTESKAPRGASLIAAPLGSLNEAPRQVRVAAHTDPQAQRSSSNKVIRVASQAYLARRALSGQTSASPIASHESTPREVVGGDFPPLPPDPHEADKEPLPPLEEELRLHGGAHLYDPEGDQRYQPGDENNVPADHLRLSEDWQKPRPFTAFQEFVGADAPADRWRLRWPGGGYVWEPRFVAYGSYSLFAFALEENRRRQDVLGHQLLLDLDLQLTGTERFHVQFRPLGRRNTGGSYYQFSNPEGYVNNMTGEPDRYWFEGEVHSMLGAYVDPFSALDYHVVAGRFPFALHNFLLLNDDVLGVVVSKNSIYAGPLSNLNVQLFYAYNDVDAFVNADAGLYGVHLSADHRRTFFEATYAFLDHDFDSSRDAHYAAVSRTHLYGPATLALRAMFKFGDRGGFGNGQLFVLESNWTRLFECHPLGFESEVDRPLLDHAVDVVAPGIVIDQDIHG